FQKRAPAYFKWSGSGAIAEQVRGGTGAQVDICTSSQQVEHPLYAGREQRVRGLTKSQGDQERGLDIQLGRRIRENQLLCQVALKYRDPAVQRPKVRVLCHIGADDRRRNLHLALIVACTFG